MVPSVLFLVVLIILDKYKSKLIVLTLLSISLSLVLNVTLISNYLVGTDIHTEYYYYSLARYNWDYTISHSYNSSIALVIIAPLVSKLFNTDGYWIFKILFPIMFSLVPVLLYFTFNEFMEKKKSFLASFMFIAFPSFMLVGVNLVKLQVGLFFLALFIFLLVISFLPEQKS